MGLKESGLRGSLRSTSSVLPAFFDVTITNTNSPVQEGDILTVDYSADNTGDAQDTQDIRLEIDSVQEDVDPNVMLAGGASTTGTLEWDTTGEAEAEYTATVLSDDDSDSVIVEIGSAIPDTLGNRYNAAETGVSDAENVDPWPDIIGNVDLTAEGTPTLDTTGINGVEAVSYTSNDAHDYNFETSVTEPATLLIALNVPDNPDNLDTVWKDETGDRSELHYRTDDGDFIRFEINGTDGTTDSFITGDVIFTIAIDETNAVLRINGSDEITVSVSQDEVLLGDLDGAFFYDAGRNDRFLEPTVREIALHPNDRLSGSDLTDEEERLESEANMDVLS